MSNPEKVVSGVYGAPAPSPFSPPVQSETAFGGVYGQPVNSPFSPPVDSSSWVEDNAPTAPPAPKPTPAPVPAPAPEPEPEVIPDPDPEPVPEPAPVSEPAPVLNTPSIQEEGAYTPPPVSAPAPKPAKPVKPEKPAKPPKEKSSGSGLSAITARLGKKGLMFGGIGLAVIIIVIILIAAIGGGKDKTPPEVGYWTLQKVESDDPDSAVDEATIAALKDLGMEMYIDLKKDGTGVFMIDEPQNITWADGKLTAASGDTLDYKYKDGQLIIELEGAEYIFVPGEGEPPATPAPGITDDPDIPEEPADTIESAYSWWDGDWYGWWVLWSGDGIYEQYDDECWDVCATIDVYDDDTGFIDMRSYDGTSTKDLAGIEITFGAGLTENGAFVSESGYFQNADIAHADWLVDAGVGYVKDFEHMICIDGRYEDPENEGSGYDYYIFLRPWGMDWEDVRTADNSENLYDDMMPIYYDDWYLPLIEAGKPMPASFEEAAFEDVNTVLTLDTHTVEVLGAEYFEDADNEDAIRIYYEVTNTSDESIYPFSDLEILVYQDEYEISTTYSTEYDSIPEYGNEMLYIRPGVTVRCIAEYSLKLTGGPVEVTFRDSWDEENAIKVSYDPQNLPGSPGDWTPAIIDDPQWTAGLYTEGIIDEDSYISILSAELTSGYGDDLIRIYFDFTNNSSDPASFWMAATPIIYQDGIQLLTGYDDDESEYDENTYLEIQPGETVTASYCYILRSDSPVEVEITDFWTEESIGARIDLK